MFLKPKSKTHSIFFLLWYERGFVIHRIVFSSFASELLWIVFISVATKNSFFLLSFKNWMFCHIYNHLNLDFVFNILRSTFFFHWNMCSYFFRIHCSHRMLFNMNYEFDSHVLCYPPLYICWNNTYYSILF